MMTLPTSILALWGLGLLTFALIGGGAYLAYEWYDRAWVYHETLRRHVFDPDLGLNAQTAILAGAVALLVWSFAGALILRAIYGLFAGRGAGTGGAGRDDAPEADRRGAVRRLRRPDGSELQVEFYGPDDGPTLVLTHGWAVDSTEWYYLKRALTDRFRLVVWDLPGTGRSSRPENRDFSLENLARDLDAVLGLAGGRPAVVLGHSIGGMVALTFCRLFPEALGPRVAGLGLVHTTYTNPVRTTKNAALYTALEKPLIVPLLHLTIWLSPLVWLMSWLSYLNGTAHLSTKRSGFAGTETWDQVDFVARFQPSIAPAVLARGMFGMLHYDATDTLAAIPVPTLVVPGDRDPQIPPEPCAFMARTIPGAQLAPLAPAKHMGHFERHAAFAPLVADFATRCLSAATTSPPSGP